MDNPSTHKPPLLYTFYMFYTAASCPLTPNP